MKGSFVSLGVTKDPFITTRRYERGFRGIGRCAPGPRSGLTGDQRKIIGGCGPSVMAR